MVIVRIGTKYCAIANTDIPPKRTTLYLSDNYIDGMYSVGNGL